MSEDGESKREEGFRRIHEAYFPYRLQATSAEGLPFYCRSSSDPVYLASYLTVHVEGEGWSKRDRITNTSTQISGSCGVTSSCWVTGNW